MSNYRSVQLTKAKKEIIEAWEWYEEKQIGLGDRFRHAVGYKITSILKDPFKYPRKGKYAQANVDDFPYLIVFDFDKIEKLVFIVSVFHTSRHPRKKY